MKKLVLILLFIGSLAFSKAQSTFQKVYSTPNDEFPLSIIETSDHNLVMLGKTYRNLYLVKMDSTGNKIWSKSYSILDVFAGQIHQVVGGGFMIYGNGNIGDFIMATDALGNMIWCKHYSYSGISYYIRSVKQTFDGGYVAVGQTPYPDKGFIFKLDALGNITWKEEMAPSSSGRIQSYDVVQSAVDSSYVVTGVLLPGAGTNNPAMLSRFDKNGNHLWSRSTVVLNIIPDKVIETASGKIQLMLAGIAQFDSDGTHGKAYGHVIADFYIYDWKPSALADKGFVLTGAVSGQPGTNHMSDDVCLVKLDSVGTFMWGKYIGGPRADWGASMVETFDKGIVIGGTTSSFIKNQRDLYIVKTDSVGATCNSLSFMHTAASDTIGTTAYFPIVDAAFLVATSTPVVTNIIVADTVMDACTCHPPVAEFTVDSTAFISDSSSWGSHWHWYYGDGTDDTVSTNPSHNYSALGTYTVCLALSNSCGIDSVCHTFNYNSFPLPIGIQQLQKITDVTISPNPSSGKFLLNVNGFPIKNMEIRDVLGKIILAASSESKTIELDLSAQPSGVYFVKLSDANGNSMVKKIVKE